jgi:Asp-tRNA(Asn)/Glu-tRNA(Gln) amidotransferase A subunit family amidase
MNDINKLSTVEAAAAIGQGKISSHALVSACLDRIRAREGDVKAWAHIDFDRALADAKAADAAQKSGHGTGPLHGVPVGVKDIIDTADQPTELGSPAFKGRQPTADAACVTALRNAGAIILGKTITTELATLTPNVTRNPHNPQHTPGGSSSGSAAAVADGMIPAALATQTGGSVIRPASFCGIFGMKPTFGTIPRAGVLDQAHSLDTVGFYGRSVEDLALLQDVLSVHDPRDAASYPRSKSSALKTATEDYQLTPLFAFVKSAAWSEAGTPEMREAFGELTEMLGSQVEEQQLDHTIEKGLANAKIVQNVELATQYGPILDRHKDLISPRLAAQIEEGRALKGTAYVAALEDRDRLYRGIEEIFFNYGYILTPAAPGPAPKGLEATGNPIFNSFWTYIGVPCVTLPLMDVDGMPLGVQLVGARRDDARLLRTARWLVKHLAEAA